MNCVNCGSPPKLGAKTCSYCETPLDIKVPDADKVGFDLMLNTLKHTETDVYKVDIVERFRKKFTAGQVYQLLRTFDTDVYRQDAAEHLVPRTTNPSGLLACTELFYTDVYRADFVELLDIDEDDDEVVEDDDDSPGEPHDPTYMLALQGAIVFLLLANLLWMMFK